MSDFINCVKNVLEEQNKTTEDLFKDGIIAFLSIVHP